MLKYFKRHKTHRRSNSTPDDDAKRDSLRSTSSFCDEVFFGDEDFVDGDVTYAADEYEIFECHSRLSMDLSGIINEKKCLDCFVHYLDSKNSLPLIKFYLDTENFKTAAEISRAHSMANPKLHNQDVEPCHCNSLRQLDDSLLTLPNKITVDTVNVIEKPNDIVVIKKESEQEKKADEIKNVPELKTLCDLSMREPLTDDEKSQIYAETNKQITKCTAVAGKRLSESQLSLLFASDNLTEFSRESHVHAASITDAINIYKKYLISNSPEFIELPIAILSQISLTLCAQQSERSNNVESMSVSSKCFDEAANFVRTKLKTEFLTDFLQSTFYCKYCVEIIDSGTLTVTDLLYSETALFYFMEFLEQENQRDCLDFWIAAINFRKHYIANVHQDATTSKNEAQTDAMIIYEKYFSLQSESRLWVSDRIRCHVEESICKDESEISKISYCFDLPLRIVMRYLETKYLQKFIESQLFASYVYELKSKNQEYSLAHSSSVHCELTNAPNTSKKSNHRKSMSDCTNVTTIGVGQRNSISQQNTLLAMDSSSSNTSCSAKLIKTNAASNMNIDARHLTDPKMLWHRSNSESGGLKFGQVNSLGRYERDFDAVDTVGTNNWSLSAGSSKIKNAVRKLVHLPEDKVQEEIAWQVAEMIVKDVTNVTMCNDYLKSSNLN